ncbi:DUF1972 domain-containing protein [Barnesiella sp. An22]|uniref:DUF1972 domain-containing protein n=1 Tax=Barnesiella sp. An22 TaxID=1965590 RepID=UPI000B38A791|nr:DUF1972 domain-containing protein [Barnesiella sp. An22]OUO96730.1 glycosyl transferase [Barnesiella sp. An22]
MKKVAIVGTQGVPASYGGFETLVENIIGDNCPSDIQYTIFCSSKDIPREPGAFYKGCILKYIPLHANGMQSIPYDIWSLCKSMRGYDCVLVLGTSGCSFLPVFRLFCHKRLVVNIDGLEFRRAKWGRVARWILRFSTTMAIRWADVIISDNKGIQDYVTETYHRESVLIAYGGDHVRREVSEEFQDKCLTGYGLQRGKYAITVCRIEPENNCHVTLEAFAQSGKKLVFIGNWKHSEYARNLRDTYCKYPNIVLLNGIYNLDILYALRANAEMYIHGHSAGGTNPSLVEAMFFGRPIIAYDVVYNRETTRNEAYYFTDVESLKTLIARQDLCGDKMKQLAESVYTWKTISQQYCSLY